MIDRPIAIYSSLNDLNGAISLLAASGRQLRDISIVAQSGPTDYAPDDIVETCEEILSWDGSEPHFWGKVWGPLFGASMLVVPGVGPVLCAGWLSQVVEQLRRENPSISLYEVLRYIGVACPDCALYEAALRSGHSFLVSRTVADSNSPSTYS